MDQASLLLFNELNADDITLWTVSAECFRCSSENRSVVPAGGNQSVVMDTSWPLELQLTANGSSICTLNKTLYEHGRYTLFVSRKSCIFVINDDGVDSWIPVYVAAGSTFLLILLCCLANYAIRRFRQNGWRTLDSQAIDANIHEDLGVPSTLTSAVQANDHNQAESNRRLQSLDIFRGLCLLVMIFVNSGAGGYQRLKHAAWNGLHFADLVFPWFIFIMGAAMSLSFKAQFRKMVPRRIILYHVFRRSAILFLLGLCLNSIKSKGSLENLRIPGVLQRFAISFLIIGLLETFLSSRQCLTTSNGRFSDQKSLIVHWPIMLAVIAGHTSFTFLLPLPYGCPTGYLGPGGRHEQSQFWNCTGGAAGFIDRLVLTPAHLYKRCTADKIYGVGLPHDPEGLLGCLTSTFLCFLGLISGKIFVHFRTPRARLIRLLFWAVLCGGIAILLSNGHQNTGWIPLNKNLWSLSFILATGSLGFLLLGVLYVLVDVFNVWSGVPIIYLGTNSIVVYCLSEVLNGYLPFFFTVPNTHAAKLALHLWSCALWTVCAYLLHKKNISIAI